MCRSNDKEAYREYDGDYAEPWRDPEVLTELYYDRQMTQQEIADHLGAESKKPVGRSMRKNGMETRGPDSTATAAADVPTEELRRLYWDERLSLSEVSDRVGLSSSAVRSRLEHHGIERREQGVKIND
jgi:DNA-binding transcriptional regulator LsrR (DeoR family)